MLETLNVFYHSGVESYYQISKRVRGPLVAAFVVGHLFALGCAQKPISEDRLVQRFSSQAYFLDKQKNKSHQMNLEIVARKNQKMRLDAKVVLGLHVASAVMTSERLNVALHAEKKSYEGPATQKAMQRSLGFPLHPLIFHAVVYRQALRGQNWSCEIRDAKVHKCSQSSSGFVITWEDQEEATMAVVDSKAFNLQWRISPPENVEERSNYFELKIPDSYEKLRL